MREETMESIKNAMGNTGSEGNNAKDIESGTGEEGQGETQEEAKPGAGTEPKGTETQTLQDAIDSWDKDPRFKTSWKEDPNRLYKNYRDIEKVYGPMKKEVETLKGLFGKYGIEQDRLEDYIKEYTELKSPDRRENKLASYLIGWLDNPAYRQQVMDFFAGIERKSLQDKYGELVPDHIVQKLEEHEAYKTAKEKEDAERKEREYQENITSTINEQVKLNEEYAKKYGIDYDDKTHNDLIGYCRTNEIDPKYIHRVFKDFCEEQVHKKMSEKARQSAIEEYTKQRKSGVVVPSATAPKDETPVTTRRDHLKKALFGG